MAVDYEAPVGSTGYGAVRAEATDGRAVDSGDQVGPTGDGAMRAEATDGQSVDSGAQVDGATTADITGGQAVDSGAQVDGGTTAEITGGQAADFDAQIDGGTTAEATEATDCQVVDSGAIGGGQNPSAPAVAEPVDVVGSGLRRSTRVRSLQPAPKLSMSKRRRGELTIF